MSEDKPSEHKPAFKLPDQIKLDELLAPMPDSAQRLRLLEEEKANAEKEEEASEQYIAMLVGDREIAFRVADIEAILDMQRITPVPGLPSYVLGICNVRGEITSVVEIRRILGVEGKRAQPSRARSGEKIIIVKGHTYSVGFVVTTVLDVVRVPERDVVQVSSADTEAARSTFFAIGLYTRPSDEISGNSIILIDTDKLLSAKELIQFQ